MFQLRKEHFEAFDQVARKQWHLRLTDATREIFPAETIGLSHDQLTSRIITAEAAATALNITSRRGIFQFVGLTFLAGERFYEIPAIAKGLKSNLVSAEWYIREIGDLLPNYLRELSRLRPGVGLSEVKSE